MFLKQRASFLLATVGALGLMAASSGARADQINVSARITASCEVGDADLDFGNFDGVTDTDATTTLTVTCSAPADVGVTLGGGLHPNGSRRMVHATQDEEFLAYLLYDGSPGATEWDTQEVLVENVSTGTDILIGGRIPGSQPGQPSGIYSDIVQVTLEVK